MRVIVPMVGASAVEGNLAEEAHGVYWQTAPDMIRSPCLHRRW